MSTTSKGPLNYTTTIEAMTTAGECLSILARHGADQVAIAFNSVREPDGLSFSIATRYGARHYSLPVNVTGTQKALEAAYQKRHVERRHTTPDHARRVAWRVMRAWLESQLAMIEAGLAELTEVMLPWMRVEPELTMYGAWQASEQKALEG
jgi:hypothetical protein